MHPCPASTIGRHLANAEMRKQGLVPYEDEEEALRRFSAFLKGKCKLSKTERIELTRVLKKAFKK